MTDQTIPADEIRKIIALYRDGASDRGGMILDALRALLPATTRPTLADMTEEERDECRWMQADVKDRGGRYVIANPDDEEGDAGLVSADGEIEWMFPERVTPRPDLPRMEWPGDQKPAPAPALPHGWRLAEHPDHGRVIVTTPEPDSGGKVAFVRQNDFWDRKYSGDWCKPDELTYLDQEDDTPTGPNTLAVGSVIESADDPRLDALPVGSVLSDCDGETVAKRAEAWAGIGYIPIASERDEFGPWTVCRIGWEADQ